jgi:FkbM family methyltransferase
MIKKFLSQNLDFGYYLIRSIDKKKKFLIIFPNFISLIFKKTLVFDKKKKSFFFIFIDNIFDYDSILEIFGQESYNLINHRSFDELIEKYAVDKSKVKVIVDCGANIGCSAIYFNKIVNNAKIICIEPDNKNFKLLKKNSRNSNFELINSAVANSITAYSTIDNKNKRAIKVQETIEGDNRTITIDSIIQNHKKDNHINFIIKIDIEGFEKNLFEKNYSWLFKFDIIIIEIHDYLFPKEYISENFFKLIYKKNENFRFECILQGENLIFFKR